MFSDDLSDGGINARRMTRFEPWAAEGRGQLEPLDHGAGLRRIVGIDDAQSEPLGRQAIDRALKS